MKHYTVSFYEYFRFREGILCCDFLKFALDRRTLHNRYDSLRKFQQQQILDVIQSLHILHGEIKDKLNSKDYGTMQTALADCQEAAIQVGEAIDQMEGTGTQAVSYLEQYCESVYQTSMQI